MNKKEYKKVFSGVHPSEITIERIMDMTENKSKQKTNFKRLGLVALALAILFGSGAVINQIVNRKEIAPSPTVIQNNINPLKVMVAYADDNMPISVDKIKAGSMNEQKIFYSIHYADITDKEAFEKNEKLYEEDKAKLKKEMEDLHDKGHSSEMTSSKSFVDSIKGEATVRVYVLMGGLISLDLDDYTNIKDMTITNNSKYGELYFNYVTRSKASGKQKIGNKISISGKELRESKESKVFECGTTHKVNKGYELSWSISDEVYKAIGNDLNFDLSQIKDTINFTVTFNDGTSKNASLKLYFDSDGYMHFE